jgi:hypothetical protein
MHRRGWTRGQHEGGPLHRLHDVLQRRHPWYDWGHPLMILTGRYDSGSWDVPRVRDLWFRARPGGGFETARDYATVRASNTDANPWRIFDSQDDGHTVEIGYWPTPSERGNIHRTGLDGRAEMRLFARWLIWDGWVRAEWFSLRRWLYFRALHRAVVHRIPFTCQAQPAHGRRDSSYCELSRRHTGKHRVRNYTWRDGELPTYDPIPVTD